MASLLLQILQLSWVLYSTEPCSHLQERGGRSNLPGQENENVARKKGTEFLRFMINHERHTCVSANFCEMVFRSRVLRVRFSSSALTICLCMASNCATYSSQRAANIIRSCAKVTASSCNQKKTQCM